MLAILFTLIVSVLTLNNANAESSLRAYGEASNNYYKDSKKLGPNATPEQKEALMKKHSQHANQLLKSERAKKLKDYTRSSSSFMRKAGKDSKLAKNGAEKNSEKPSSNSTATQTNSVPSSGNSGKHRVTTTGTVTGSAGAKEVRLEPVQKKDQDTPAVQDGIIQER